MLIRTIYPANFHGYLPTYPGGGGVLCVCVCACVCVWRGGGCYDRLQIQRKVVPAVCTFIGLFVMIWWATSVMDFVLFQEQF